ncbi:hypothetical protein HA402_014780 [Bradysia odoriphaga]|nr:hypothetical protein HA402_014780 [Bradysia odoriphaga]
MSRGGRHSSSLRIEKSYWLFDTESISYEMNSERKRQKKKSGQIQVESPKRTGRYADNNRYETDSKPKRQKRNVKPKRSTGIYLKNRYETDSDRKRKGSQINGPPNKKIRQDTVSSGVSGDMNESDQTVPLFNENKPKSSTVVLTRNGQSRSDSGGNSMKNDLFDDVESIGSEYEREAAFVGMLFDDMEHVASDITEVSSGNNVFPRILNIFYNDDQDDENEEDKVIITEIFDDDEQKPEKPTTN